MAGVSKIACVGNQNAHAIITPTLKRISLLLCWRGNVTSCALCRRYTKTLLCFDGEFRCSSCVDAWKRATHGNCRTCKAFSYMCGSTRLCRSCWIASRDKEEIRKAGGGRHKLPACAICNGPMSDDGSRRRCIACYQRRLAEKRAEYWNRKQLPPPVILSVGRPEGSRKGVCVKCGLAMTPYGTRGKFHCRPCFRIYQNDYRATKREMAA